MNLRHLTVVILIALAVSLSLYDIFVIVRSGTNASISDVLLTAASQYPIIVLALGVLLGHLFWPQRS